MSKNKNEDPRVKQILNQGVSPMKEKLKAAQRKRLLSPSFVITVIVIVFLLWLLREVIWSGLWQAILQLLGKQIPA